MLLKLLFLLQEEPDISNRSTSEVEVLVIDGKNQVGDSFDMISSSVKIYLGFIILLPWLMISLTEPEEFCNGLLKPRMRKNNK